MMDILRSTYLVLDNPDSTLQASTIKAISAIVRISVISEDGVISQAIPKLLQVAQSADASSAVHPAMSLLVDLT